MVLWDIVRSCCCAFCSYTILRHVACLCPSLRTRPVWSIMYSWARLLFFEVHFVWLSVCMGSTSVFRTVSKVVHGSASAQYVRMSFTKGSPCIPSRYLDLCEAIEHIADALFTVLGDDDALSEDLVLEILSSSIFTVSVRAKERRYFPTIRRSVFEYEFVPSRLVTVKSNDGPWTKTHCVFACGAPRLIMKIFVSLLRGD